jgi:hypothetical protein
MSFAFECPVGVTANVIEQDYISALHQLDVQRRIRKDCSIQGTFMLLFCMFATMSIIACYCSILVLSYNHSLVCMLLNHIDADASLFLSPCYGKFQVDLFQFVLQAS